MGIELNHTIVTARDRASGARWLADVLGLPAPVPVGPFHAVELANGVTLDFMATATVTAQHYAFLVGEAEFDEVSVRLAGRGIATFADPGHREPGHNTHGAAGASTSTRPTGTTWRSSPVLRAVRASVPGRARSGRGVPGVVDRPVGRADGHQVIAAGRTARPSAGP